MHSRDNSEARGALASLPRDEMCLQLENFFVAVRSDANGDNTQTFWSTDKTAAIEFCPAPPATEDDGASPSTGWPDKVTLSLELVSTLDALAL